MPELVAGPLPLVVSAVGSPSHRRTRVAPGGIGRSPRRSSRSGTPTLRAGPDEADIVNQPGDMSFVIRHLLTASADRRNPLAELIDPGAVADHRATRRRRDGAGGRLRSLLP
jgi:hypothetical protein